MGEAWVGPRFRRALGGKGESILISADGLRQFRAPSVKGRLGYTQANFEWKWAGVRAWQGNGHLDIIP
jgi:hypothetical protein